jgi:hypothetical protein
MKDTPESKDRLLGLIGSGAEAQSLLRKLDPGFAELQNRYRSALVHAVRVNAGVDAVYQEACKLAALDDLYGVIRQDAVTGARAQKTANELEKAK